MFFSHMPELIVVLVIALLIFGPKKLPEMGSSIGKSIKEFRKGMNELNNHNTKEEKVADYKMPEVDALESEAASKRESNILKTTAVNGEVVNQHTGSEVSSSEVK